MDSYYGVTASPQSGSLITDSQSPPFIVLMVLLSKYGGASMKWCTSTDTLCGNDGRTYLNMNQFQRARAMNPWLRIAKYSPCNEEVFYFYCPNGGKDKINALNDSNNTGSNTISLNGESINPNRPSKGPYDSFDKLFDDKGQYDLSATTDLLSKKYIALQQEGRLNKKVDLNKGNIDKQAKKQYESRESKATINGDNTVLDVSGVSEETNKRPGSLISSEENKPICDPRKPWWQLRNCVNTKKTNSKKIKSKTIGNGKPRRLVLPTVPKRLVKPTTVKPKQFNVNPLRSMYAPLPPSEHYISSLYDDY